MSFTISDIEDSDNTINVLLLGETGVGKSTFINSLANYIQSKTFEEASKSKTQILIPTRITVYNEEMEEINIAVGSDSTEKQEIGSSATQTVKTYLFPLENEDIILRLIDTPGLGDTEGPNKDDKNCEEILAYLANLNKINGICLLMKPTNDRSTVLFSYCVRRILSQLHKSASENMIFLFTNTKGSDYSPGSTLPILKKMACDIEKQPPYVKIPINKNNVFCLDNECLKQLLALEHGVEPKRFTIQSCSRSWEIACEETQRFLKYVQSLKPHNVKQTLSINQARDLILQLSKPLSEICQLVQENILKLQAKEVESKRTDQTIEELKKKLYKPVLDLEVIELERCALVCTDIGCIEIIQVDGTTKYNYKTRCHEGCRTKLPYELVGNWSLMFCSQMNWTGYCKHCGCSYTKHMIIYYETRVVEKQVIHKDVDMNIKNEEKERQKINAFIKNMLKEKQELEEELQFIGTCAAKFAYYLQNNAITSSYDNFKEYIFMAIQREKSLGNKANLTLIANLNDILKRHDELIKTLNEQKLHLDGEDVTFDSIHDDVEKLFTLKHSGAKIKEIVKARAACVKKGKKLNLKTVLTNSIPNWFFQIIK